MRFYLNLTTLFLSFKIFANDSSQVEIFNFDACLEDVQLRFEGVSQEEQAHEWAFLKNTFSSEFDAYLKRTIDQGSIDDMRFVLNFPSMDFNLQNDEFGDTFLIRAARDGDSTRVALLLDKGAKIEIENFSSQNALTIAASLNHWQVFKIFHEKNIDLNTRTSKGLLALTVAASANSLATVRILVNRYKINPDSKDSFGNTPLTFAIHAGHIDMVKELVKMGADINAQDGIGRTPLMKAALRGKVDIFRFLWTHPEINIKLKNKDQRTVLDLVNIEVGVGFKGALISRVFPLLKR